MKKLQITLDENLAERLDACADENYLSRSGLISLAVTQFINQTDIVKAIVNLSISMQKIADTGKVTPEQLEQLEDMKRLANMLSVAPASKIT